MMWAPSGGRAESDIIDLVQKASTPVVRIYTRPWCGYCTAASRLLDELGVPYEEIRLEEQPGLRERLQELTGGWRTVPMIFVGRRFIGGYTDATELHRRAELLPLIRDATAAAAAKPGP